MPSPSGHLSSHGPLPYLVFTLFLLASTAAGCASGSRAHHQVSASRQVVKIYKRGYGLLDDVTFVRASSRVREECQRTADALRYPVPCPTMLPQGLAPTPPVPGCRFAIIGAGSRPGCKLPAASALWDDWIVGSSQVFKAGPGLEQHLVLQGAPRVVSPAHAVDGPYQLFPGTRVQALGVARVGRRRMHWYFVPPATNQGSAFQGHLVLVWDANGHSYAYGFHVLDTMSVARALDLELARNLITVYPRPRH